MQQLWVKRLHFPADNSKDCQPSPNYVFILSALYIFFTNLNKKIRPWQSLKFWILKVLLMNKMYTQLDQCKSNNLTQLFSIAPLLWGPHPSAELDTTDELFTLQWSWDLRKVYVVVAADIKDALTSSSA